MIIYPAIDLKDGHCVRLYKGDMTDMTVYNANPASQALDFVKAGFSWLHIVDLDGAVDGAPENHHAVRDILSVIDIPVQLGGGIRTMAQIEHWLEEGVSRVILGTSAIRNPELVREAAAKFPDRIVVGLDARNGRVSVEGWTKDSGISTQDAARHFEDAGVAAIIFTDIERDGTHQGVNIEATVALAQSTRIPVIASGGIGSLDHLQKVKEAGAKGIEGVIIGKAFYDKKVSFAEALAV